jgi:hypothetical protein
VCPSIGNLRTVPAIERPDLLAELPFAATGSGLRRSKLALPGATLAERPGAEVDGLAGRMSVVVLRTPHSACPPECRTAPPAATAAGQDMGHRPSGEPREVYTALADAGGGCCGTDPDTLTHADQTASAGACWPV